MEINIEGYSYYFKNDENLDEKDFIDRCWYVAKNLPKNPESFNKLKSLYQFFGFIKLFILKNILFNFNLDIKKLK